MRDHMALGAAGEDRHTKRQQQVFEDTLAAAPDAPGPDPDYPPSRLALEVRRQVLDMQT